MNKVLACCIFCLFIAVNPATAQDFKIDSESEWNTGDFVNTTAEEKESLKLEVETFVEEWSSINPSSAPIKDIQVLNDNAFVLTRGDELQKINVSNGNVKDSISFFVTFQNWRMAKGENRYLYVPSNDTIRKIDTISMTEVTTGNWPYTGFSDDVSSITTTKNLDSLIATNGDGYGVKINKSNGAFIDSSSLPGNPRFVEMNSAGNFYLDDGDTIRKYDSNLNDLGYSYTGVTDPEAMTIDNNGNVIVGFAEPDVDPTNDYVAKLDPDLSEIWITQSQHNDSMKAVAANQKNDVFSVSHDSNDKIIHMNGNDGSVIDYLEKGSSLTAVSPYKNDVIAGGYGGSSSEHEVFRYTSRFYPDGNYSSKIFDGGDTLSWRNLESNITYSGSLGNFGKLNVFYSDSNFGPIKATETFDLKTGKTSYSLSKESRYLKVNYTLFSSTEDTSIIDYFSIWGENASTEIVGPNTDDFQNDDFTVDVDDSGSPVECSYRINYSLGWGSWQSRSCPDGDFTIDITSGSAQCRENGFDECQIQTNVTAGGGTYDLDTAKFNIFNYSTGCIGDTVGCWLLEEGEGQALFDYSGKGRHAVRGLNKSDSSTEPIWKTGPDCHSTTCLRFKDSSGFETKSLENTTFDMDNFTISADVKKFSEASRDWIFYQNDQFGLGYDRDRRLFAGVKSPACGGWCGDDTVESSTGYTTPPRWFNTTYQAPIDTWKNIKASWNGTHMSFFEDDNLIVSKTSSKVSGYSPMKRSSGNFSIGYSLVKGNHGNMTIDKIGITNYSTYPKMVCKGSENEYINIGEDSEKVGRLKEDKEFCVDDGSGVPHWYDQDFGDVDGDGVQDTCKVQRPGVKWVSEAQVSDPSLAPAFTEGVDDDWTEHLQNLEDTARWDSNTSKPDASSWGPDESPLPTGVPGNDSIATKGFCLGDDEGEFLITQSCATGLCETNRSVYAASSSPNSCTLSTDVNGFSGSERKIYQEGNKTTLNFGPESQEIACYGGQWFDKWPASFLENSVEANLGTEKTIKFKLINTEPTPSDFKVSMSGPMSNFASFTGEAQDSVIRVGPRSSKDLDISFSAVRETSTPKTLTIDAESVDGDFSGEDTVSISVSRGSSGDTGFIANVPGLTLLEIMMLFMASSAYFYVFS